MWSGPAAHDLKAWTGTQAKIRIPNCGVKVNKPKKFRRFAAQSKLFSVYIAGETGGRPGSWANGEKEGPFPDGETIHPLTAAGRLYYN